MTSEDLDTCVSHVLDSDPVVRGLTRDILRLQRNLKRKVDDEAWRAYLRLEAAVNHRQDEILRRVAERLARGSTTRA